MWVLLVLLVWVLLLCCLVGRYARSLITVTWRHWWCLRWETLLLSPWGWRGVTLLCTSLLCHTHGSGRIAVDILKHLVRCGCASL